MRALIAAAAVARVVRAVFCVGEEHDPEAAAMAVGRASAGARLALPPVWHHVVAWFLRLRRHAFSLDHHAEQHEA